MKYSYFPGCSLKGLGRAYEESLLPVMRHLGVELRNWTIGIAAAPPPTCPWTRRKPRILAAAQPGYGREQRGRTIC